ncbi:MAG: hypothetical protein AB7N76_06860 [Planctomycetota bacterium]
MRRAWLVLLLWLPALAGCSREPVAAPATAASPAPSSPGASPAEVSSADLSALGSGAATPQAVFLTVQRASQRRDFAAFHAALTPRSQRSQTRVAVLAAVACALEAEGPEGDTLRQRLIALAVRHGVLLPPGEASPERVQVAARELDALVERGAPAELYSDLSRLVHEARPGSALSFSALEGLTPAEGGARGVLVLRGADGSEERQPVRFEQRDGCWLLDLGDESE